MFYLAERFSNNCKMMYALKYAYILKHVLKLFVLQAYI